MQPDRMGEVSFWYADIGMPVRRPALDGDATADVCIIGAGYTGLWAAWYLKQINPGLQILVIEKEFAGFGASGRNGGWLTGGFAWTHERYLKRSDEAGGRAMVRVMNGTVDEVIQKANNTPYGLSAGVWTDKGSKIFNLTSKLRAGVIWANTYNKFDPTSPFGGYKESGHNLGVNPATGQIHVEINGLVTPQSPEATRICQEDLNEVIATFIQDKTNLERGLFDEELVPDRGQGGTKGIASLRHDNSSGHNLLSRLCE